MMSNATPNASTGPTRRAETLMFLALSVLVWPIIAIGSVSAYGFSIWIYQLLTH